MLDLESRKQLVIDKLGDDFLPAGKYELRYQCPNCMDIGKTYQDYKLYVNFGPRYQRGKARGGKFFCHRCELKGDLGIDGILESNTDVIDYILKYGEVQDDSDEYEEVWYMIPKSKPVEGTLAWDYITSRGITQSDIDFYDIRVPGLSDGKEFFGRFVIPNRIQGKIFTDMYVARDYLGRPTRYRNPYSSARNHIVFNLHRIPDNTPRIILNEGSINSIIAGRDSVASYGKYVSDNQLDLMLSKRPEKFYVSLDRDAISKAEELCYRIKSKSDSTKVYLLEFPDDRDASDLGREKYTEILNSSREYVSKTMFIIENFIKGI